VSAALFVIQQAERIRHIMFGLSGCTVFCYINPLTPELNASAQRCLTRFLLTNLLL
jgi:hypothetical protein